MKKPNKKNTVNLFFSAFLILAFVVCAHFFSVVCLHSVRSAFVLRNKSRRRKACKAFFTDYINNYGIACALHNDCKHSKRYAAPQRICYK